MPGPPPGLVMPLNTANTLFAGHVVALKTEYRVAGRLRDGLVDAESLVLDPALREAIAGAGLTESLRRRLCPPPTPDQLLCELSDVATAALASASAATAHAAASRPAAFAETVVDELARLGGGGGGGVAAAAEAARLTGADASLSELELGLRDAAGREHALSLQLAPDYPRRAPHVSSAALPAPLAVPWPPPAGAGGGLAHAAAVWAAALHQWQPLWAALDDLDAHLWVLEPPASDAAARRTSPRRRVTVAPNVSLVLELDPHAPTAPPASMRLLGASAATAPIRARLDAAVASGAWRLDALPRANLEAALGAALPSPADAGPNVALDYAAECAICYAYLRDADEGGGGGAPEAPDSACENPKCGRPFHRACLCEWLRALPTSRTSFDTLFGACPYCSEPLSVKIAER